MYLEVQSVIIKTALINKNMHQNKKTFLGLLILSFSFLFGVVTVAPAVAVDESCSGVVTAFNATAPASVNPGQSFSITGISSRPSTSYGVTVLSSTLSLSATNSTPATYSMINSSTDPSPTTGAPTYTAYYPNYALTASGAAGSSITVKLVQASANISGIGIINCTLTATLATIPIVAPPPAPEPTPTPTPSSGGTSSTPTTTKPNTKEPATTPTTDKPVETTPTNSTKPEEPKEVTSENYDVQAVSITVKDKFGKLVNGAVVTIDGQLSATTVDGMVTFEDIRVGEHVLGISYGGHNTEQLINVQADAGQNELAVEVPFSLPLLHWLGIATIGLTLFGITAFLVLKIRSHKRLHSLMPVATITTSTTGQPVVIPESQMVFSHQPQVIRPTNQPTQNLHSTTSVDNSRLNG